MKNRTPLLSVIMPVYNGQDYLVEAIESILTQTFKDFELITVNDGSIDNTLTILRKLKDKRVIVIDSPVNLGLAKAMNLGIKKAKGKYIAKCDADDINMPTRFALQIRFLDRNGEYVLVGGNAEAIDQKGKKIGYIEMPESDKEIRRNLIRRNCLIHPTVMYKTDVVKRINGYREIFNKGAEEYDLWFRLLNYGKSYNLQKKLIKRRFHDNVYTKKHHFQVETMALLVRFIHLFDYLKLQIKQS